MNDPKTQIINPAPSFMDRVLSSDAARKGIAGAVAGLLVAVVTEAIWGSGDE